MKWRRVRIEFPPGPDPDWSPHFEKHCYRVIWYKMLYLWMHLCTITKSCMYHRVHDLKVLKKFWDSEVLRQSKDIMKFQINANSSLWILPIVTRLVLIDSLGHAENSDTNVAIVSKNYYPPFWFSLKTYFFELLDRCSDFHQNRIISSSDHAHKKLWILCG